MSFSVWHKQIKTTRNALTHSLTHTLTHSTNGEHNAHSLFVIDDFAVYFISHRYTFDENTPHETICHCLQHIYSHWQFLTRTGLRLFFSLVCFWSPASCRLSRRFIRIAIEIQFNSDSSLFGFHCRQKEEHKKLREKERNERKIIIDSCVHKLQTNLHFIN